ncbi:MAG: DUF3267 domain-containing protein [Ruminococcaceae bacterium]|nr:DUF3267 domain-containing protein [Oscillospiraceae bacterium]
MKSLQNLPEEYAEIYSVNLQKNKKIAVFVNVLAIVIAVVMTVPMHFYIPITKLFDMQQGLISYSIRFIVLSISVALYMVLHELIHGITMKYFGTKKVKYGFTGMYAFAGSDDYYDKRSYITIALAPVIVFAVVFAILNAVVPAQWFWVVYILQVVNISGAAGDLFVTIKFSKMPKDILVFDYGIGMTVYSKTMNLK